MLVLLLRRSRDVSQGLFQCGDQLEPAPEADRVAVLIAEPALDLAVVAFDLELKAKILGGHNGRIFRRRRRCRDGENPGSTPEVSTPQQSWGDSLVVFEVCA